MLSLFIDISLLLLIQFQVGGGKVVFGVLILFICMFLYFNGL